LINSILRHIESQLNLSKESELVSESPIALKLTQTFEKYVPLLNELSLSHKGQENIQMTCLVQIQQFAYHNKMPKGNIHF
jgi:hypothetical protein